MTSHTVNHTTGHTHTQLQRICENDDRSTRTAWCGQRHTGAETIRKAGHSSDFDRGSLSENITEGTPLGLQAKRYLDAGDLVPGRLTNALVEDRISEPDVARGFILDGYPRSVEQAVALHDMLQARNASLDCVLEFQVAEGELLKRLMSRGRADDTEEVICNRMKVYRDETAPLLDHYRENLTTVDAVGAQVEVFARALQALGIVDDHASANGPSHTARPKSRDVAVS